jgi:alpha-N-arabinofuranosidase
MSVASIVLDSAHSIGSVPRRLFGSFVEHMGRCVYTGIYEPGHPRADERGFRGDVAALTREIAPTLLRYPGGNFVSNFRWEDSIGPRAHRPTRLELAWHSLETNQFGLHEFVDWADDVGAEVMLAVNLSTRDQGLRPIEYTNHPAETLVRRRIATGARTVRHQTVVPRQRMDGPWRVGHKTVSTDG